ncbi:MAG: hypothetical protein CMO55_24205 [Verrucomicrobiales bacterium]|nr:hypothetical protein [Verrucomicrobiales bacterium]
MSEESSEKSLRAPAKAVPLFSFARVWTIASSTVTQLVRMKTFYFLLAFALIIVGIGNFNIPATPAKELSMIKKVAFGTMDLFAWLFAIISTALLIPRDQEDRTLYTILSKPVRRIEYLFGKLFGVLAVVATSLVAMFVICAIMIYSRETLYVSAEIQAMEANAQYTPEEMQAQVELIRQQGLRPELTVAVLASFLKASVVAAVTIFISTFASSSLFTIIISILVFLIGHAHSLLSNYWTTQTDNIFVIQAVKVIKVIIPNFQLFSFSEGIVQGAPIIAAVLWQMVGLTGGYLIVYVLLSLLVFVDKEF